MRHSFSERSRTRWIIGLENRLESMDTHQWGAYNLKQILSKLKNAKIGVDHPEYYSVELSEAEVRSVFALAEEGLPVEEKSSTGVPENFKVSEG